MAEKPEKETSGEEKDKKDAKDAKSRKIDVTVTHKYENPPAPPTPAPSEPAPNPEPAPASNPSKEEEGDGISMEEFQKKMAAKDAEFAKEREKLQKDLETAVKEKGEASEEVEDLKEKFRVLAEEEFNEEKALMLESAKKAGLDEDKLKWIEENLKPENLEMTKTWINMLASQQKAQAEAQTEAEKTEAEKAETAETEAETKPPEPAPAGAVEMPVASAIPTLPQGKQYADARSLVRDLYWTAYYDKNADPKAKRDAQIKIKTLWSTLFERAKEVSPRGKPEVGAFTIIACPKCGWEIIDGFTCEACGHVIPKPAREHITRRGPR